MRRFSVSLLLFLTSAFTFGQQAPHNSPGPEVVHPIPTTFTFQSNVTTVLGCPVGLSVDRRSDVMTRLSWYGRPTVSAQGLHIRLIHFGPAAIESAEITVHGVTSRAIILPVGVAASNQISKTFVLHPGDGGKGWQEATVWMERASVLTSAELNSLTYTDGSVWHEAEGSRCYAVPSPFLLVGAK
jgi:hypothetical protein